MHFEHIANIVVIIATASTLLSIMRLNKSGDTVFNPSLQFGPSVTSFLKQVELLEEASKSYFNTLNNAGLNDLISMRNQLKTIIVDREKLIREGKVLEANLLVEFVNSPISKPYKKLYGITDADLHKLANWKEISQNKIMNCVIQLGISSNSPSSSPSRMAQLSGANKRRATFYTLNELKEIITDRRVC